MEAAPPGLTAQTGQGPSDVMRTFAHLATHSFPYVACSHVDRVFSTQGRHPWRVVPTASTCSQLQRLTRSPPHTGSFVVGVSEQLQAACIEICTDHALMLDAQGQIAGSANTCSWAGSMLAVKAATGAGNSNVWSHVPSLGRQMSRTHVLLGQAAACRPAG